MEGEIKVAAHAKITFYVLFGEKCEQQSGRNEDLVHTANDLYYPGSLDCKKKALAFWQNVLLVGIVEKIDTTLISVSMKLEPVAG